MAIFNGSEGRPIDLAVAEQWAANYRASLSNPGDTLAHFFGFEIIQRILQEPGCMGIRIYYGIDDQGKKQLMLVGADANGDNLLPASKTIQEGDPNIIADVSFPCPDYCPEKAL